MSQRTTHPSTGQPIGRTRRINQPRRPRAPRQRRGLSPRRGTSRLAFVVQLETDPGNHATEEREGRAAPDWEPPTELTDINGIGPARARRLGAVGIESIADLAAASVEEIAAIRGVSESMATEFKEKLTE